MSNVNIYVGHTGKLSLHMCWNKISYIINSQTIHPQNPPNTRICTFTSSSMCLFSSSICWVYACLPRVSWEIRASFSSSWRENSPERKKRNKTKRKYCWKFFQNKQFKMVPQATQKDMIWNYLPLCLIGITLYPVQHVIHHHFEALKWMMQI